MPHTPPIRTPHRRARAGFSLIEVSLALVVAAGGLLSIFGLFPVSLRQSKMSERDMAENAFATTLLETMAGNARMIDDVEVWNNPTAFLRAALGNTGLLSSASLLTGREMNRDYERIKDKAEVRGTDLRYFSPDTVSVGRDYEQPDDGECIWYLGREEFEADAPTSDDKLVLPPQFLIRLAVSRRDARARSGDTWLTLWQHENGAFRASNSTPSGRGWKKVLLPNVYVVSVVSTDGGFPETYVREPLYSQEFTFLHRP